MQWILVCFFFLTPALTDFCLVSFAGMKKPVISGQHTVKALMELRRRYIDSNKELPEWLRTVSATVLKPETPVHWRQMIAGDEQYKQGRTVQLQMSDFAQHLLGTAEVKETANDTERLLMALRKCGFDRGDTYVCCLSLV